MNLRTHTENDIFYVQPTESRLDANVAVSFREQMKEFIDGGQRTIALDLERVEFIDSSGLGSIVASLKAVGKDGDILICGVNESIHSMFRLARMDKVFKIYASVDDLRDAA